jgi:GntR family histidine utilization transcriptional repressor
MNRSIRKNWRDVMAEVERRIYSREWQPGQPIPNEADLAVELGCARVTVNRALRTLADVGLLDRRRKAGTRVALHPVGKATLFIPLIRHEIEENGKSYTYHLISQKTETAPAAVSQQFSLSGDADLLHVVALHEADGQPYVLEDRWINNRIMPHVTGVSFSRLSANEWLLQNIPFTHGDIGFGAKNASQFEARVLATEPDTALFLISRTTWDHSIAVTMVDLVFHKGHRKHTKL